MKISQRVIRSLCLFGLWLGLGLQAHAQTDTVTYVYTDPQGTPLVEADAQGNVIARYDYTPYGNAVASLGSAPNGPGYTGHVNDPETGLVYMQARYYDPGAGRFLSPDPVMPIPGNVYSFNRYAYANNNPVVNTDPTGKCVEDFCIGEGIAACIATPCGVAVAAGAALLVVETVKAIHATEGFFKQESRSKPPSPLPEAEGHPHSIPDGKGGYTTYPDGDANNGKQYRPDGKPHGDIERPNVKEWKPNSRNPKGGKGPDIVRKPTPDEIPSIGNQPPPPPPPKPLPESAE